jgi:hypothetical protein
MGDSLADSGHYPKGDPMLKKNVGTIDRTLRIILGLGLLAGFLLNRDGAYSWLYLIGIIPLVTGLMSSCPLYSIFGLSTCPLKKQ